MLRVDYMSFDNAFLVCLIGFGFACLVLWLLCCLLCLDCSLAAALL